MKNKEDSTVADPEVLDLEAVEQSLASVVKGKADAIELVLVGLLSGGHILLEDVPGVGKTTLGKALARCFEADFSRIQFHPSQTCESE